MKSTTAHELHTSAYSGPEAALGGCRSEKYSLRQRQRRRPTARVAAAYDSCHGYVSDNDNNNNNHNEDDEEATCGGSGNNNASDHEYALSSPATSTTSMTTMTRTKAKSGGRRREASATTRAAAATGTATGTTTTTTKAKAKAAPLSKYRRKTANARERTRMREINSAFENLRHCVPHTITGDDTGQASEKLTKITTLRLAMKYISVLTEALANPSFEADFLLECKRDGDHRFTTRNWQQQPTAATTVPTAPSPSTPPAQADEIPVAAAKAKTKATTTTRGRASAKAGAGAAAAKGSRSAPAAAAKTTSTPTPTTTTTTKAPARRQTKKQKLQQSLAPYVQLSPAASTCSSGSPSSAYASLSSSAASSCSPPSSSGASYLLDSPISMAYLINNNNTVNPYDHNNLREKNNYGEWDNNNNNNNSNSNNNAHEFHQSMSDLSSLMLESDGESLHLSEPCLSPLQSQLRMFHGGVDVTATSLASLTATATATTATTAHDVAALDFDHHMTSLENPLELSLRLLDSSADSLDFAGAAAVAPGMGATIDAHVADVDVDVDVDEQHAAPASCISPLITLDSFNPFADLLHSDFAEHSSLDLFLT